MKAIIFAACIITILASTGCTSPCSTQSNVDANAQIYTTLNEIHQDLIRLNESVNKSKSE